VFTEPLLRNVLRNPALPPLLGKEYVEKSASSIVACWAVFTELLPGNALIKSLTVSKFTRINNANLGKTRREDKRISMVSISVDNSNDTSQFFACAPLIPSDMNALIV
jgi:hypothetical protein